MTYHKNGVIDPVSDGGGIPSPTDATLPMLIASAPIPLVSIVPRGSAGWTGLWDGTVGAKNVRSYRSSLPTPSVPSSPAATLVEARYCTINNPRTEHRCATTIEGRSPSIRFARYHSQVRFLPPANRCARWNDHLIPTESAQRRFSAPLLSERPSRSRYSVLRYQLVHWRKPALPVGFVIRPASRSVR